MTEKKPGDIVAAPSGGVLREFVIRLKLIARLMGDRRVNFFLKILPLATIAYLIWPFDISIAFPIPGISALDDIAIVSLGNYLFVELCPPGIVKEHLRALASGDAPDSGGEVVDAEVKDVTEEK
jgi:uncharacterized membrane protein YkvA (DUF1232 family)